jgi:hypothetical protein
VFAALVATGRGPVSLMCGKSPIAAESSAGAVRRYDPEMIRGVRIQATDVGTNVLIRVPRLSLGGCCGSVAGRSSILKIHGRGQSVRMNRAV